MKKLYKEFAWKQKETDSTVFFRWYFQEEIIKTSLGKIHICKRCSKTKLIKGLLLISLSFNNLYLVKIIRSMKNKI